MDTSNKEAELTEALLNMIRVAVRNHTVIEGVVQDVDTEAFTCEVSVSDSNSSVTFSDVPLETLVNSQASFIFSPNKGSHCLLIFRDGNQDRPQLLKVDSAQIITANPTEKFVFGKGTNGGLVLVQPLVTHTNIIENSINDLKELIGAWVPVPGDGGASLKAVLSEWLASVITPTTADDLQSKTVLQ